MPQRSSHIGLFDAKSDCGVTAPVVIRSNETPMGRKLHTRPAQMPVYSNAAGASPGQHTIPNAILLSELSNVKYNCANFGGSLEKSLSFSTNPAGPGAKLSNIVLVGRRVKHVWSCVVRQLPRSCVFTRQGREPNCPTSCLSAGEQNTCGPA